MKVKGGLDNIRLGGLRRSGGIGAVREDAREKRRFLNYNGRKSRALDSVARGVRRGIVAKKRGRAPHRLGNEGVVVNAAAWKKIRNLL